MTAPRCQIRSIATEPPAVDASEPDRDNAPSRVGLVRPPSTGHGRRLERFLANRSCMAAPQDDEQIGFMLKRLAAGEATAHGLQDQQIACLDPAIGHGGFQGQGDRCSRRIGVPINGHHHLFGRNSEAFAG